MEDKSLIIKSKNALTPAELVEKHISHPEHLITDDEMINLKVGEKAEDKEEFNREVEEKEAEDNTHNHENNPYDILNP
jgi:hypothetical protein